MTERILCKIDDLPCPGRARRVETSEGPLCIANVNDSISVLDDVCIHDRRTSLAGGEIEQGRILCPRHGWAVDLKNGELPHLPNRGVRTYPVILEDGNVKIRV